MKFSIMTPNILTMHNNKNAYSHQNDTLIGIIHLICMSAIMMCVIMLSVIAPFSQTDKQPGNNPIKNLQP
jgi:hypothetical protein